jgi:hypothetical protein
MKKADVKVGGRYSAKLSDKVVVVRIDGENAHGGWEATNTATGKKVRIKSAQRLRGKAGRKAAPAAHVALGAKPAAEAAKDTKVPPAATGSGPAAGGEAKAVKAAKVAAMRKDVAEKLAKPDPELDAAVKAAEEGRRAKKAKAAKPKGERKGGVLDAAVQVLKTASGGPLGCKEMVERMLAKGLWKTNGRTPQATLYAAIIREIAAKGKDARFHKTGRGQFELSAAGKDA